MNQEKIRNICIIAHVDHGKTTLVDGLLKQTGQFASHEAVAERVMDSNDLEREKGITILAKNTSVVYKDHKINIVDTPGHADFGGEVERIMGMVDGAILLVDALEGPLPQTRFVLKKAIAQKLKIILCINKVDRKEVQFDHNKRINEVVDSVFDLFVELEADDDQCQFPIIYCCARDYISTEDIQKIPAMLSREETTSLNPVLDNIVNYVKAPEGDPAAPFLFQVTNIKWSDFLGQLIVGRILQGQAKKGQQLFHHKRDKETHEFSVKRFQASKLFTFSGLKDQEVDSVSAGEIAILAGAEEVQIGDTIAAQAEQTPLDVIDVEEPTLKMMFGVNTSPRKGMEGDAIQIRKLKERLQKECRSNIALGYEESEQNESIYLKGRGELQFTILIESLRREGLEFTIGRPEVMYKKDEQGNKLEPIEELELEIPEQYNGDVTQLLQNRKGILTSYEGLNHDRIKVKFLIPSRGLIGMRSQLLSITRGEGLYNSAFHSYEPFKAHFIHRKNGAIVTDRSGKATDYSLLSLEDRGVLFITPATEVYEGMIIGEHNHINDINVNAVRAKKLTNVRSVSSDGIIILQGVRSMSLEDMMTWIDDDECIECTPESIRMRKKELNSQRRSVIRAK